MERLLKSPFVMMIMLIFLGLVYIGFQEEWKLVYFFLPFVFFFIGYYILVYMYNKKNPDNRIKIMNLLPYELREDDEGLQWITYKATRKVYIFYYYAIPIGIVAVTFLSGFIPYFPILLLVVFGVIQYFIFWFEFHQALKEEEV